ncbi:MAG: glutamate-cysteine ligase family protein [Candidatus Bathyarchaeota archaeon]|nr:glutamate-cysteine ligase family protein [Candidatus Bathyarchaeota archaeon]
MIKKRGTYTYKPLEVIGPENEFSIVSQELKPLPISDQVIKANCGRMVNFVELPRFTFGKEMQMHVIEVKAKQPFQSPRIFEETIQEAVVTLNAFLEEKFHANLLGTGMHPLLRLSETGIWPHYHKHIYEEYGKIFNLKQHGWLNIQSFHLNLPYGKEKTGIQIHNVLANICTYLPAVAASSPIYEGNIGSNVDNRLAFYKINQKEVPSITGEVIPESISSFEMYRNEVIGKYSRDLACLGVDRTLLFKEWVNSRGVIFRFDRAALEVRVMDEQECIKADVALSCFVRATARGLINNNAELTPHSVLVSDFNEVIKRGLEAKVLNPHGSTARDVCQHLFDVAWSNATEEEKEYLPLVQKRISTGNLSDIIKERVLRKAQRTTLQEAIVNVYSMLIKCLANNQPYF